MFRFFRKNYLYSKNIDPHCAYCAHCTKDNEHQGVCDLRGIVALAGQCRKFVYNPLMRVPAKPARIRGRFTDEDFLFIEHIPDDEEETDETTENESDEAPDAPDGDEEKKEDET